MKKLIILIAMVAVATFVKAQGTKPVLSAPTTTEEYNYITKGYKIQMESGLDMKKGYKLVDLTIPGIDNLTVKFLVRESEQKPCATMLIYKSVSDGSITYLCVPTSNASGELWKEYGNALNNFGEQSKGYLLAIMSMCYSLTLDGCK